MVNARAKAENEKKRGWPSLDHARLFVGLAIPLVMLVAAASPFLRPLGENLHSVIPGCVYRSGQLSPESLEDLAVQKSLRSIINLRGANPGQEWYEQERAVARRQGLRFYDLPVDSQCPTAVELRELLRVLERCPKPLLIHCQSGIDRSGIVAAICILLLDESGSLEEARTHLGWRYGQMPWRENLAAQETFLQNYQSWLTEYGQSHSPGRFRDWLLRVSGRADS